MHKTPRVQNHDWKDPIAGVLVMLLSIALAIFGMEAVIAVTRFIIG